MMKITYLLLPVLSMTLFACSSQQEEDYIETPEAEQISDLQDDDKDGVVNARDTCLVHPKVLKWITLAAGKLFARKKSDS